MLIFCGNRNSCGNLALSYVLNYFEKKKCMSKVCSLSFMLYVLPK